MQGFFEAIADYRRAMQLVSELRLWAYFVIPALISLATGAAMIWLVVALGDNLGFWLASLYPFEAGLEWARRIGNWLGYILIAFAGIFLFKYIVIIVLAPVLSPLSQRVENALRHTAGAPSWSVRQIMYEGVRGLRINLRNIVRELFYTVLLIIFGFVPVIGLVSGALILAVQAFYAGFGNMDFTLERHYSVRDSVRFVRANRGYATGNGLVFILVLMFPVLGLLFAPPLAVIAATVGAVRKIE